MIALTSISPVHINKDIQQKAVNSWRRLGMHVYSFNHSSEMDRLKDYKGVTFIQTKKTMQHIFGKPYVQINEMIDFAKGATYCDDGKVCFINSDIELAFDKHLLVKIKNEINHKMVICHRNDYLKNKKAAEPYILGIDVFFMNKKHLDIFPPSLFCMGQCFWDYNIPFTAIKHGIEVINLQNKFAYHKKHPVQYSEKNWEITGKYFIQEHNLHQFPETQVGRLNELAFNFLKLNTKKVIL